MACNKVDGCIEAYSDRAHDALEKRTPARRRCPGVGVEFTFSRGEGTTVVVRLETNAVGDWMVDVTVYDADGVSVASTGRLYSTVEAALASLYAFDPETGELDEGAWVEVPFRRFDEVRVAVNTVKGFDGARAAQAVQAVQAAVAGL